MCVDASRVSLSSVFPLVLGVALCALTPGVAAKAQAPAPAQTPARTGPAERPERIESAVGDEQAPPSDPFAKPGRRRLPGLQPDGDILLPNQWSLRPAGQQSELGDFPVNIALHPRGGFAAIMHSGNGAHEVITIDLRTRDILARAQVPQTFYGLCFDREGSFLFASGGESEVVYRYEFDKGSLGRRTDVPVVEPKTAFVVGGLTTSPDNKTLFACGPWGDQVAAIDLSADPTSTAAPATPKFVQFPKDSYPYVPLSSADGSTLFVSLWGGSGVGVIDAQSLTIRATWSTPRQPTEMAISPDGRTLFVACANSNLVAAINTADGSQREVINVAMHPDAPHGSTPSSLALSKEGDLLLITSANTNTIAVFNVETPGKAKSMGFIPTGWYPTSVRFGSGGEILYTSGKGLSPRANRNGPNPEQRQPRNLREYIGSLFRGSLGVVKPLTPESLAGFTRDAYECSPLLPNAAARSKDRDADNPVPARVGDPSPIKHCIYIVKENRTYDQVFGDMPEGNGDPSLCIFGEEVTPNQHKLAREFVLFDNFYVDAEVSADGHEWTMGAYASDFVEKVWPLTYRSRPPNRKLNYPSEGVNAVAASAGGYFWDTCKEAGVTYRSYGEWIRKGESPGGLPAVANVAALEGHFDPMFMPYDTGYPDVKRAERFISELNRFEAEGEMPRFQVVRMGNDHTAGTRVGGLTPRAMVADNDLAVGMVIEALCKTRFWKDTAVFILEDDAQNGPDHVDAHRSTALVISPYTKRGVVDSTMYSTTSVLRTMGLILGTRPMTQFDAAAQPMYASFTSKPDFTPYTKVPSRIDLDERNVQGAWGADLTETLDLAEADAADDLILNEIVWRSVKGADSPMPAPRRAAFVFIAPRSQDADD